MRETDLLGNIARLRSMLHNMEQSLGIASLSPTERDALYAAFECRSDLKGEVSTDQIAGNELMAGVPEATFHRAVRTLVKRGFLRLAPGRKRGLYIIDMDQSDANASDETKSTI